MDPRSGLKRVVVAVVVQMAGVLAVVGSNLGRTESAGAAFAQPGTCRWSRSASRP